LFMSYIPVDLYMPVSNGRAITNKVQVRG